MSDEPRDPQLENVLDLVIEIALDRIQCMMPGQVVSYDSDRQMVSVQPLVQKAHLDENLQRVSQTLPVLNEVPVAFYGNSKGRITFPVAKGDVGMIHFSSLSIARWKLRGGVVDPGDDRRHDPSDCLFYPGGHDAAHVPTEAPTDAVVIHSDSLVKVGGPDADQAAVGESALDDFTQALSDAIDAANTSSVPATLDFLKTALGALNLSQGWKARTSKVKVK